MEQLLELLTKNPEVAKELISGYVETYKPLLYAICEEVLNIYKDYANNEDYFNIVALARKNQFDAYMRIGFNKQQAMSLMLTDISKLSQTYEDGINKIKNR